MASSARRLPQEPWIQVPNPRFLSQNPDLQRTAEREPRHAAAAAATAGRRVSSCPQCLGWTQKTQGA